jgi:hypothetical protein
MDDLHITIDPRIAKAIGRPQPVRDVAEMRELSGDWDLQSLQSPVPQGLRAVEAAGSSAARPCFPSVRAIPGL